jgi:hypothetical protein
MYDAGNERALRRDCARHFRRLQNEAQALFLRIAAPRAYPVYVSSDSYPRRAGRMLASVRKAWIENETATSPRNCSTPEVSRFGGILPRVIS